MNSFVSNISYRSYKLGVLRRTVILLLECSLTIFYGLFPCKVSFGTELKSSSTDSRDVSAYL